MRKNGNNNQAFAQRGPTLILHVSTQLRQAERLARTTRTRYGPNQNIFPDLDSPAEIPSHQSRIRTQLTFCNGGILRLMQFALSFLNRKSRYVRTYVHTIFSQRDWPRSTIFASVIRHIGFATFRWMVVDGRDHSNFAFRIRACVGLRHVLEVINVYAIPSPACP